MAKDNLCIGDDIADGDDAIMVTVGSLYIESLRSIAEGGGNDYTVFTVL